MTDPLNRVTTYTYTQGRFVPLLTQVRDHWNRTVATMAYDPTDRVTSYNENGESYTHDYSQLASQNRTIKRDSQANAWTLTTSVNGYVTDRLGPNGADLHKDFNADGSIQGVTDEVGIRTNYTYDSQGHALTVARDALHNGPRTDYTYDSTFPDKVSTVTVDEPRHQPARPRLAGLAVRLLSDRRPRPRRPPPRLSRPDRRRHPRHRRHLHLRHPGPHHPPDHRHRRRDRLRLLPPTATSGPSPAPPTTTSAPAPSPPTRTTPSAASPPSPTPSATSPPPPTTPSAASSPSPSPSPSPSRPSPSPPPTPMTPGTPPPASSSRTSPIPTAESPGRGTTPSAASSRPSTPSTPPPPTPTPATS